MQNTGLKSDSSGTNNATDLRSANNQIASGNSSSSDTPKNSNNTNSSQANNNKSSSSQSSQQRRTSNAVSPPLQGCPDSFTNRPEGISVSPPSIVKQMSTVAVTVPYGGDSASFNFTAPDTGVNLMSVRVDSSMPGINSRAVYVSGQSTHSATVRVYPAGQSTMQVRLSNFCYDYILPVRVSYALPPPPSTLELNSLSYIQEWDSISYSANAPVQRIDMFYTLNGCEDPAVCIGSASVNVDGTGGTVSLPSAFPQLNTYFQSHNASSLNLTVSPYSAGFLTLSSNLVLTW